MTRLLRAILFVLVAPAVWLLGRVDAWIWRARFNRACNAAKGRKR